MRNLKFIVGFTLTGFVISLFCGFFSHSSFVRVFLQALIFAVIFAVLAFIIQLLFEKFLDEGSAGEAGGDISADSVQTNVPKKGSKVDFVIQDEDLPLSESENQFSVGENHQLLNESDIKKDTNVGKTAANSGFVPLQKESFENLTGTEAKTSQELNNSSNSGMTSLPESKIVQNNNSEKTIKNGNLNSSPVQNVNESQSSGGEVDVLPDMNEVITSSDKEDREEDVAYSPSASSTIASAGTSDSGVDVKDASLLAKAISSILSGDS